MRPILLLALISGMGVIAPAAELCNPRELQGSYGFLLTGETNIAGPKPAVALGLLAFDGSGGVSGTSSIKYAGLLLGNPVTGTYTAGNHCEVAWALQDDSGAYQHFSGVATPDEGRISFRQTDLGGAPQGVLVRVPAQGCTMQDLQRKYAFSLSGTMIPMTQEGPASSVSAKGVMAQDSNHHFALRLDGDSGSAADVDLSLESDCTMDLKVVLPVEGDATAKPMEFHGILVDGGKEILAIQSDPGAVVSARFTAP